MRYPILRHGLAGLLCTALLAGGVAACHGTTPATPDAEPTAGAQAAPTGATPPTALPVTGTPVTGPRAADSTMLAELPPAARPSAPGSETPPSAVEVASLFGGMDAAFGELPMFAVAGGDLNGDGLSDAAVGVAAADDARGVVYSFYGKATLLRGPAQADAVITGETPGDAFGRAVANLGDGYADLAVGASGYADNSGKVYVFFGGPQGFGPTHTASTEEAALGMSPDPALDADFAAMGEAADYDMGEEALLGTGLAIADFDGDGYGDLLAGAPKYDGWRGQVYLLRGGPDGLPAAAPGPYPPQGSALAAGQGSEMLGAPVAGVGDVDGDGRNEIAAGATFGREGKGDVYLLAAR